MCRSATGIVPWPEFFERLSKTVLRRPDLAPQRIPGQRKLARLEHPGADRADRRRHRLHQGNARGASDWVGSHGRGEAGSRAPRCHACGCGFEPSSLPFKATTVITSFQTSQRRTRREKLQPDCGQLWVPGPGGCRTDSLPPRSQPCMRARRARAARETQGVQLMTELKVVFQVNGILHHSNVRRPCSCHAPGRGHG